MPERTCRCTRSTTSSPDLVVRRVPPPGEHVGLLQHLVGQAVLGVVQGRGPDDAPVAEVLDDALPRWSCASRRGRSARTDSSTCSWRFSPQTVTRIGVVRCAATAGLSGQGGGRGDPCRRIGRPRRGRVGAGRRGGRRAGAALRSRSVAANSSVIVRHTVASSAGALGIVDEAGVGHDVEVHAARAVRRRDGQRDLPDGAVPVDGRGGRDPAAHRRPDLGDRPGHRLEQVERYAVRRRGAPRREDCRHGVANGEPARRAGAHAGAADVRHGLGGTTGRRNARTSGR